MCACRLQGMHHDGMKPTYELEDYIYEMENRNFDESPDPDDIYAQLAQKEKDLILAAELGKALLEKNEDLSRQNERIAEEYSQKLEVSTKIFSFLSANVFVILIKFQLAEVLS